MCSMARLPAPNTKLQVQLQFSSSCWQGLVRPGGRGEELNALSVVGSRNPLGPSTLNPEGLNLRVLPWLTFSTLQSLKQDPSCTAMFLPNMGPASRTSVPRPSSYPLLGPKYLLLGTIYPQLRVQGGS